MRETYIVTPRESETFRRGRDKRREKKKIPARNIFYRFVVTFSLAAIYERRQISRVLHFMRPREKRAALSYNALLKCTRAARERRARELALRPRPAFCEAIIYALFFFLSSYLLSFFLFNTCVTEYTRRESLYFWIESCFHCEFQKFQ